MTPTPAQTRSTAPPRRAQYRYGAVFLGILTLLVFEILAPDADWARAVDVALAGGALAVAVATSGAREPLRRQLALAVSGAALVAVVAVATGLFSSAVASAIVTICVAAIPVTLVRGLLRLIGEQGVTAQAVAGGLVIYLPLGLLFASVIASVAHVQSGPYFTQGAHVSSGDRVYYSFTVLTTTGFGDYTAATGVGHAVAVLEMLTGQLYLVTVIGVLVGNFVGRRN